MLEVAGVADRADSDDLIAMIRAHDVKHGDARAVLEAVDRHLDGDHVDPATPGPDRPHVPEPAVGGGTPSR